MTIAITQNFCNKGNFERVWRETRKGRKKLSVRFLALLKDAYPEQYNIAIKMNEDDNFVMWDQQEKYKHLFKENKPSFREGPAEGDSSSSSISSSDSSSSDSSSDDSSSSSDEQEGSTGSMGKKHNSPPRVEGKNEPQQDDTQKRNRSRSR